jgi:RNA polymerase sigma factor (sigma-70 family)
MSPTDGRDELRGRFTRWIVITAENAQKNYLRAEKKQLQTVPLEETDVAIVDTALLSAGVSPDSFDFEEQRLAEAFRELPLMRRRILEMLFVEELTPSEIAAKLHCSVQHVYNQRSLAIKRLRERLIKERKNDRQ